MDEQVLRQTIPGLIRLELLDEHKHDITLYIRQAPLLGRYAGQVTVTEQHYPYHYNLAIQGEGRQSTISGQGVVHLHKQGDNTIVAYQGKLNIGKLGTLLPPALVKGAAKLLLQHFFTELAEHLRTLHPSFSAQDTMESNQQEEVIIPSATTRPTLMHKLRSGRDKAAIEEQWLKRVRRVGIASGLLFLVWIGTQLPKRLGL
ncbi:MAG: hypothetical protein NVS4B7_12570 [Ktedonobacteraceae bacterium]